MMAGNSPVLLPGQPQGQVQIPCQVRWNVVGKWDEAEITFLQLNVLKRSIGLKNLVQTCSGILDQLVEHFPDREIQVIVGPVEECYTPDPVEVE